MRRRKRRKTRRKADPIVLPGETGVLSGGSGRPEGQWVCFRVEHVLVKADQLLVVGEEQEEVLERLAQEEALHLVPGPRAHWVTHVGYGGVAPRGHLTKMDRERERETKKAG